MKFHQSWQLCSPSPCEINASHQRFAECPASNTVRCTGCSVTNCYDSQCSADCSHKNFRSNLSWWRPTRGSNIPSGDATFRKMLSHPTGNRDTQSWAEFRRAPQSITTHFFWMRARRTAVKWPRKSGLSTYYTRHSSGTHVSTHSDVAVM
jgi:hypothetical protein